MELFKDTHITKLELLSNSTTIDSALQFIRSKQQQEQHKKRVALDSINDDDDDADSTSSDSQITTTVAGRQAVF